MNGATTLNEPNFVKLNVYPMEKCSNSNLIDSEENSNVSTKKLGEENNENSRFQTIRVDRNSGCAKWKIVDFESAETNLNSTQNSVSNVEQEINGSISIKPNDSSTINLTSNGPTPVATGFPQQRLSINNPPLVLPHGNVGSTAGILHPFPAGALTNLTSSNQSFLLANHPQFGYYPFYPAPFPPAFAHQWATIAASNPFLSPAPPPTIVSPIPAQHGKTSNVNESFRLKENEINNENSTGEHLTNAGLATTPFLYAPRHSHSPYVPQNVVNNASPYATIPSYHPVATLPTIVPPNQQTKPINNNPLSSTNLLQSSQSLSQQPPLISSPRNENAQNLIQHPALIITPKTKPPSTTNAHITDLISTSPSSTNSQQAPISLLSPIPTTVNKTLDQTTAALTEIWSYTNSATPLNRKNSTGDSEIHLLNDENSNNNKITDEILKELTTPTEQNTTTDIDNKISAAMDLVKMHLLSAVREEVIELRQQIRILQDKLNSLEHENSFLRHHVSSEIYAQYIPVMSNHSSNIESTHSSHVASSQTIANNNSTSLASAMPIQGVILPNIA